VRGGFILLAGLLTVSTVWLLGSGAGREVVALWSDGANALAAGEVIDAVDTAPAPVAPPSAEPVVPAPDALRVLFVGNSHTYFNNMPAMIAGLAQAAGKRPLFGKLIVRGGATLGEHAAEGVVSRALSDGGWHALVLQEQQQYLSFGQAQRERQTYAPARIMSMNAQAHGARSIVQMVWARREGDPTNVAGDTYAAMHERSVAGHRDMARTLGAELAPSAIAWKRALTARPDLELWLPDGSHPSPAGSYLAACVLYKVLYGASPSGVRFTGGLHARDAAFLQEVAATTDVE
jgi:hypothetical protein